MGVLDAAAREIPSTESRATVDMYASITLTFRTSAAASVVLEDLLAAMRNHAMPYELASTGCSSFDMDEIEE